MPDYQKMYVILMNETEKVINSLIAAQRKCEEIYISVEDDDTSNIQGTENEETESRALLGWQTNFNLSPSLFQGRF